MERSPAQRARRRCSRKIAQMQGEVRPEDQEAVEAQEFSASVGGGVVEAMVNGKRKCFP
jgi:DNA-binding protein YbaB